MFILEKITNKRGYCWRQYAVNGYHFEVTITPNKVVKIGIPTGHLLGGYRYSLPCENALGRIIALYKKAGYSDIIDFTGDYPQWIVKRGEKVYPW